MSAFSSSHQLSSTNTIPEDTLCQYYADDEADIVLRTSDGVLFKVHGLILKLASDVFEGMLSIPQGPSKRSEIVQLTEEADVMQALLDSIYPRRPLPELKSFDFVLRFAAAADKYDIPDVTDRIRNMITSGSSVLNGSSPLQQYALATRFGWVEEARVASASTTPPNTEFTLERRVLETMSTEHLLKLFSLHRRRHLMLASVTISFSTNTAEDIRARQLRWEYLSTEHLPCRSQHINRTAWIAFKYVALEHLARVNPVTCNAVGFGDKFWSDQRLNALWDDECTKCGSSFFEKETFIPEFDRLLRQLPMFID